MLSPEERSKKLTQFVAKALSEAKLNKPLNLSNQQEIKDVMQEKDKIKLALIIFPLVLFAAYLKEFLYYKWFFVNISDYKTLDEVLIPQFLDILIYSIIVLLTVGVIVFMKNIKVSNSVLNKIKNKSIFNIYLMSILLSIFILTAGLTFEKIQSKLVEYKIREYVFRINDLKITTNANRIYLGRTKNKLFLFNRLKNSTDIINTKDIKVEGVINKQ